jgi:hypothetical protein
MSNAELYEHALSRADELLSFASATGESVIAQDVCEYVNTGVETPGYREGEGAKALAALYIELAKAAKPVAPVAVITTDDQDEDWSP